MENRSGAKIWEKWERKWKMAPGLKSPKSGRRNGKNGQNPILGSIFPFRWPFFGHFRPGAIFHFISHFFRFLCAGPVSHHRRRKKKNLKIANFCVFWGVVLLRRGKTDPVQFKGVFKQGPFCFSQKGRFASSFLLSGTGLL